MSSAGYALPIIIPPYNTFNPPIDNNNASSIEEYVASLQNQQQNLQIQLTQLNQQINALQSYLSVQKSLGLQWINAADGSMPKNAMGFSINNQTQHICHVEFMKGIHPGVIKNGGCMITYGGYSLIEPTYQVLSGHATTQWQIVSSMQNYQHPEVVNNNLLWQQKFVPIQGGYEKGSVIYICQAIYNNSNFLGKVVDDNCNFALGAQEIYVKDFQVLFGEKR
jgi:hypothetical protein